MEQADLDRMADAHAAIAALLASHDDGDEERRAEARERLRDLQWGR